MSLKKHLNHAIFTFTILGTLCFSASTVFAEDIGPLMDDSMYPAVVEKVSTDISINVPLIQEVIIIENVTNTRVNFRVAPNTDSIIIKTVNENIKVEIIENLSSGWTNVKIDNTIGYMKSEYISAKTEYDSATESNTEVELVTWSAIKTSIPLHTDMKILDIRSGLTYNIRSFSNGNHSDVEPATKTDTETIKKTYGGTWSWDARPVWVTINGKTYAASINGMPHGGGVISDNGMSGQICLHFKSSTTHNGNKSYEKDLQAAITEAWNAVK